MCNIDVDDWRIRDFDDVWTCLAYICTVFDGIVGLMYDTRDTIAVCPKISSSSIHVQAFWTGWINQWFFYWVFSSVHSQLHHFGWYHVVPSYHLVWRCDRATLGGNQEDQSESVGSGHLGRRRPLTPWVIPLWILWVIYYGYMENHHYFGEIIYKWAMAWIAMLVYWRLLPLYP